MKTSLSLALFICLSIVVVNRTSGQDAKPIAVDKPQSQTNVDQKFELNITERRFIEENFKASTSVSTDGDAGLNLQIGVGLSAARIEVLMRNVRGSVRFHGTLDRILEILRNRGTPPPTTP